MSCELIIDTVGFAFDLTVLDDDSGAPIDISAGNGTLTLDVEKPDGTVVEWVPVIIDGPTGLAQYKTVAGDLDQVGTYRLQGHWDPVSPTEEFWTCGAVFTARDRVK